MKRFVLTFFATAAFLSGAVAQTLIIDYSEHARENTASIHLIESKLPIESESFNDIKTAKTKLVRTIENYHTDGYFVRSSNVTTHKSGRGYHYHYQYILQKAMPRPNGPIGQGRNIGIQQRQGNQMKSVQPGEQVGGSGSGNGQGKVQINSDRPNGDMQQERQRIIQDGSSGQVKLIKQPDPVE
jgi:hypothetical protein